MPTVCAEDDNYPSYEEIEESLGKTETILLYFFSTFCLVSNVLMYAFTVYHLYKLDNVFKMQVKIFRSKQEWE